MEIIEINKLLSENHNLSIKSIVTAIEKSLFEMGEDELEIALLIEKVITKFFINRKRKNKLIYGSINDYHNLSVVLSRAGYPSLSCMVLENGINTYFGSVDLLADYLEYSIECEKHKDGKKYFDLLQKIPKEKWTWRAYDFSIDYLVFVDKITPNSLHNDLIIELINQYKTAFYNDERAYLSEANFYQKTEKQKSIQVLIQGIENVHIAPLCCLNLAKLYFDEGEYYEANKVLSKCKEYSLHMNEENDIGNVFYLSTLCKMAIYYLENAQGKTTNENLLHQIYYDYKSAEKTCVITKRSFKNLRVLIDILSENAKTDLFDY